jgi:hypothetical protein
MNEPIAGHYEGFRMFHLAGDHLCSISGGYEYEPGVNQATCRATSKKQVHEPPVRGCGCGFWLYHREHRARLQFGHELAPVPRSGVGSVYGDFGEAYEFVLGKVLGGGKAIVGHDGCRVAQVRIVALVTDTPSAFVNVLRHYGIEAIQPAMTTTAWVVAVDEDSVLLETPDFHAGQETGLFTVVDGVQVPAPGTRVVAEFERRGAMRFVTRLDRAPGE